LIGQLHFRQSKQQKKNRIAALIANMFGLSLVMVKPPSEKELKLSLVHEISFLNADMIQLQFFGGNGLPQK